MAEHALPLPLPLRQRLHPGAVAAGGEVPAWEADAFHAAGVAHGGTTCEDPPGLRGSPGAQMYIAYLRDPDGNKICALHRVPR